MKKEYYDTLLANFKEGLSKLIQDPSNKPQYAVDRYWFKLQMQDYFYLITPLTVIQYDNYSDIEQKQVSYTNVMLDLDKEWITKQRQVKNMHLT